MESTEAFSVVRMAAAIAVLAYASLLDLRTRRVPNGYWIGLSVLGLVLLSGQIIADDGPLAHLAILLPIILILADVFVEARVSGKAARTIAIAEYASAIIVLVLLSLEYGSDEYFRHLITVPAMMLVVVLLYMLDAVKGGADAKALISLAILFPFYPNISSAPLLSPETAELEIFIPFTFAVLVTAAIIVAVTPIGFLVKNIANKELRFPQALLGYRMNTEDARGKHVWLMERVVGGEHLTYTRPKAEEDLARELSLLEKAGYRRVWVTPKVPFIVPMLVGLVVCATLGNPLLLLFPA